MTLDELFDDAIWVCKVLFDRKIVTGSSANMSFKHENRIYITGSNTCFGRLTKDSFAVLNQDEVLSSIKPSKELPLHKYLYENCPNANAVIHTHSTFATYWSCKIENFKDFVIPTPTPYLNMKVGNIIPIPYQLPGTKELFDIFKSNLNSNCSAYLLENHGPIFAGKTILDAFYGIEEIEEASKNAWLLKKG